MNREEAIERIKVRFDKWALDNEDMKALNTLIPELAESEDERIRKHLIKIVETYWGKTNDPGKAADLAYLEKQKEQNLLPGFEMTGEEIMEHPLFLEGFDVGRDVGHIEAEQKPAELEQLAKLKEMTHEIREAYERGIEVGRAESKQEWSDSFEEAVADLIERAKQGKCDSLSPIEEGNKLLAIAKHGKVNQQEWSEEDVDMLNSCISSIEEAKENRYAYKETDGDTSYDHEIAWLKSFRNCPKSSDTWKPSEYQIQLLLSVINDPNNAASASAYLALKSLYNDLKKL